MKVTPVVLLVFPFDCKLGKKLLYFISLNFKKLFLLFGCTES